VTAASRAGAANCGGRDPGTVSVGERHVVATNGTWMRSSSPSPARSIGSGVRSAGKASFSTWWSKADATRRPPKRLFRKLLKKQGLAPQVLITDKLKSYAAAKRGIMPGVEHRQHKGLNNRATSSHQLTRRRERIMKRFKSSRQVQRFRFIHDQIANVFLHRPSQDIAAKFHSARKQARGSSLIRLGEIVMIL
jgi:DDE domain